MGIGEPMDNYDNVITFLHNVNNEKGLNIGYRHITISTCGVADKIEKLADEALPINLAISLHAPNDEIRNTIMPINKAYNIKELIGVCKDYYRKTSRRISFEYSLISGVNDSYENAKELASLVKPMSAHVNLIPVNEVKESGYKKGTQNDINRFLNALTGCGVNATIRRELGSDISASCGQLRKKTMEEEDA
jgi:23S rRNA (adenine2503-C2)-methyltransferase